MLTCLASGISHSRERLDEYVTTSGTIWGHQRSELTSRLTKRSRLGCDARIMNATISWIKDMMFVAESGSGHGLSELLLAEAALFS